MNKIKDITSTMWFACYYSLRFCWRNSKLETSARIIAISVLALLGYLRVKATGGVISALQADSRPRIETDVFWVSDVSLVLAGLACLIVFGIVMGRVNWYYRSTWNQKLRFANSDEIKAHKASLDVACFNSKRYDDLTKQIEELPYGWGSRYAFAEQLLGLFSTASTFVIFGLSIFIAHPVYGIIILGASVPMMVSEFQVVNKWWKLFEELVPHHKRKGVLTGSYSGSVTFMQLLMFNQDPVLSRQISENQQTTLGKYDDIRRFSMKREMAVHIFGATGLFGVIAHASWSFWTHQSPLDLGGLTVLMASAYTFQSSFEGIVSTLAEQWNSAKGIIMIEREYFGLKPLIQTIDPVKPDVEKPPCIVLDKVCFSYPESARLVLKDIDLVIPSGSTTAIVGPSGCGKSTVISLLMRHYDPTKGTVMVDSIDLRRIRPQDWTRVVSALTQKFSVLDRTVGLEIASSDLERPVDIGDVARSARLACFDEVVSGEQNGYDTQIGTEFGGKEFSGGEERRLALARAAYRGTPVLILDEPDTGLDPENAQKMMDNIFALTGVTVIIVTHHVSRAERCDHVVMMGKGEIAEQGTHAELMAKGGRYAELFKKDRERLASAD